MIPQVSLITVEPRPLNARLWELVGEELAGTISPERKVELDCLCAELEGGAMPSARAGRATPRAGARLGHSATIAIADNDQ